MENILDDNGVPHKLHLTVRAIETAQARGVDFRLPDACAEELYTSDLWVVGFLWAFCGDGDRDTFVDAWSGDSIGRAREAIERETLRFFSSETCARFAAIKTQAKKMAQVRERIITGMAEMIEAAAGSPERIESLADSLTARLKDSGKDFIESLGLSASTPAA